jgi:hypothetical protein
MSDLQELTDELMQDPDFKKEYEALQPEMDIKRAILDVRIRAGMTQMELAEKSGISQAEKLSDVCVCCGKPAQKMIYWGKAY